MKKLNLTIILFLASNLSMVNAQDWNTNGNFGITPANFIGPINFAPLNIRTSNTFRAQFTNIGSFEWQSSNATAFRSFAIGTNTQATAVNAVSINGGTQATGAHSFASGLLTDATGVAAFSTGKLTFATGVCSFTAGLFTQATAARSMAFGFVTNATAPSAIATGQNTNANGTNSATFGQGTTAGAARAFATGFNTNATGANSFTNGQGNNASAVNSASFGNNNQATAPQAFATGNINVASGFNSFVMGEANTAAGQRSLVMGNNCSAAAAAGSSFSGGSVTNANGPVNFAYGEGATTNQDRSVAIGHAITANASASFVYGTGINNANPLINNQDNTLIVGFESDFPTLFVSGGNLTAGSYGRVGIGDITPGNQLEITSDVNAPQPAGLRFTNLTSTSGTQANPGPGVLSVDPNGDVIYVTQPPVGIGLCPTPSVVNADAGFELDGANFYFTGNGFGNKDFENVAIGLNCTTPEAKLDVLQQSGDQSTWGINSVNNDVSATFANPSIGVKVYVEDQITNFGIGGFFESISVPGAVARAIIVPQDGGFVGFQTTNPGCPLDVVGDACATAHVTTSDAAFKQNIQSINNPLNKVCDLKGLYFHYDTLGFPERNFESDQQIGFIAQSVDSFLPEIVHKDKNGYLAVDYGRTTALLVEAIKELKDNVDSLQQELGNCCNNNYNKTAGNGSGDEYGYENDPIQIELGDAGAILYQNMPNPFGDVTTINYFVPERIANATVLFTDEYGRVLRETEITQRGKGSIEISAKDLATGIYTYSLVVDGEITETKKMVHTK